MVDENRQFHPSSLWGAGSRCWAWLKQGLIHWSLIDRCLLRPAGERRRLIYHFGEMAVVTYCYCKNMCHKDMYACVYVRKSVWPSRQLVHSQMAAWHHHHLSPLWPYCKEASLSFLKCGSTVNVISQSQTHTQVMMDTDTHIHRHTPGWPILEY